MKIGWESKRIGEFCDLATGGTPSRSKPEYFDGDIKWLVSGDIHRGEIYDCEGRITEAGMRNSNAKLLPLNSVMIALNGQGKTRGTVALLRTSATCNQSLVCIIPKPSSQVLPEFLYANLHGRYAELRQLTSDDDKDRRGLNMGIIRRIEVPLPPLPEQQRIVRILDEAFAAIATAKANTEKNLQNARALFESHLQSVFTQRGDGWVEKTLGDLATFRNGINYTKNSKGERIKIVGVRNFQNHFNAPLDDLDTVTIDGKLNEQDSLKRNDILAVRSNGNIELIGRCILVDEVTEKISHSGFTIRIRLSNGCVLPKYVCHFMKSAGSRKLLTEGGIGTNIKSLNQGMLSALSIPFPPIASQKTLVEQLESMSEETQRLANLYERKLSALEALKKSLLHQAFTGAL